MFYSDTILAKKGPLANIWLAAHWDKKLTKVQVNQTDIVHSVNDILEGRLPPMALRLSGQLLLGVAKIYWRKAKYLFDDCNEALFRIKVTITTHTTTTTTRPGDSEEGVQTHDASVTIPVTGRELGMLLPEPEVNLEAILESSQKAANISRVESLSQTTISMEVSLENQLAEQGQLLGFDDEEAARLLKEFNIELPRKEREPRESISREQLRQSILSPIKGQQPAEEVELERRASFPPELERPEMEGFGGGFEEIPQENVFPNISVAVEDKLQAVPFSPRITRPSVARTSSFSMAIDESIDLEDEHASEPAERLNDVDLIPDNPSDRQNKQLLSNLTFDSFMESSLTEMVGGRLASMLMQKANIVTPTKRKLTDRQLEDELNPMQIVSPEKLRPEQQTFFNEPDVFGGGFENESNQAAIMESPLRKFKEPDLERPAEISTEEAISNIEKDEFLFDEMLQQKGSMNRQTAVESFLDVLTMTSKGHIKVKQPKPFDKISITKIATK